MTVATSHRPITSKSRDQLKDSDFAIPEDRSYPIHDRAHARKSLALVVLNSSSIEQARVRKAVARRFPELGDETQTDNLTNNVSMAVWQRITTNLKGSKTRTDFLEGKECYVVPMVMLTEGVHNGSNGPLYYSPDELSKTPVVWNYKPIVVYHPQMNGKSISACDKTIIESRKVGVILNTKWTGSKLKAEAWIEKARVGEVDPRVKKAIENNQPMEVSTGLFTDNKGPGGKWRNENYQAVATNFRPDHLALLPDQKGSCSMEDGAGLNMNAEGYDLRTNKAGMSHSDLRDKLNKTMQDRDKTGSRDGAICASGYINDVFDTHCIVQKNGKTYSQPYAVDKEGNVKLDGLPQEVVREVRYKTADGKVVGNSTGKDLPMKKNEIVDALIANAKSGWVEEDRDSLMDLSDDIIVLHNGTPIAEGTPSVIQNDPKVISIYLGE